MSATKRMVLRVGSRLLLALLLLGLAYTYQRSRFIQKANTLFDPEQKAFTGLFLPWPIGNPSLFGSLDPKSDSRIRASLDYDSGNVSSNGMNLVIHASDGTFIVHAK